MSVVHGHACIYIKKYTRSARIPINLPSKLSRTFQFARLLPEHLRPPPPAGGGGDVRGGAKQREGEEGVGGGAGDPAGSKPGPVVAEAPLKQALKLIQFGFTSLKIGKCFPNIFTVFKIRRHCQKNYQKLVQATARRTAAIVERSSSNILM